MSDIVQTPSVAVAVVPPSRFKRRVLKHKGLMIGTGIFAIIVLIALLAPLISPHDPYTQDLNNRLVPPVWYERGNWLHPFGTDNLGRDYLSRTLYGCLLYTSPSPRDRTRSRMPSSA